MTKKKEDLAPLPPTAEETEIPKDVDPADEKPVDAAPLDPKEEARRRSREDLERKRRTLRQGRR